MREDAYCTIYFYTNYAKGKDFYFEDRTMLASGKSIALIFTILDIYVAVSCIGGEKVHIFQRPRALGVKFHG